MKKKGKSADYYKRFKWSLLLPEINEISLRLNKSGGVGIKIHQELKD